MSRINVINQNYQQTNIANKKLQKRDAKPSFTSSASTVEEYVAEYGKKNIEGHIGWKGWLSKLTQNLAINKGEIQTQKVNAIFTSTLAPAFIAFNPISKKDKKTKEYTALRQPISAFNSILISVPLTILLNQHTEMLASQGKIGITDLRCCPNGDYLKREFNREFKKLANNQASQEEFINSFSNAKQRDSLAKETKSVAEPGTKAYKKLYKEGLADLYKKAKQAEATGFFTQLLYKTPEELKADQNILNGLAKNNITNLDRYLEKNNFHSKDCKQFLKDQLKLKFFEEKIIENGKTKINLELKESAFLKKIEQMRAADFLRQLGLVSFKIEDDGTFSKDSFKEENLRKFLSMKREEPVIDIVMQNHNFDRETATKEVHAIGKMISRQIQHTVDGEIVDGESIKVKQMLDTLGIKTGDLIEQIKTKNTAEFLEYISSHFKGMEGLTGTSVKEITTQFIKNNTPLIERKFGGIKNYVGIFFNLGISALACTTLNWSYPRIVEALFPSLVKDSATEGGKK